MSTFRVNKNVNYTVMSNHHLQDKRLSLKAKGLLSYMLSLPDDWDYSLKGLTVGCKDGLDSVRTAVLELEEHGYVRRQKVRNAKGQIIDYDYQVYESPVEDAPAVPGKEGGPSNPSATKSPKSRMKPCSSPFWIFQIWLSPIWKRQRNKILINKILKDKVLIYQGRQANPQILTRWKHKSGRSSENGWRSTPLPSDMTPTSWRSCWTTLWRCTAVHGKPSILASSRRPPKPSGCDWTS